jgi:hypothetical protein
MGDLFAACGVALNCWSVPSSMETLIWGTSDMLVGTAKEVVFTAVPLLHPASLAIIAHRTATLQTT